MTEDEDGGRATLRVFAVAALAIAGLGFSATPISQRLDGALLDAQWTLLRRFDPRPAPDDIIVVGVDEATLRAIPEPPGMWHEPLGKALARIAAARPRAIGLDLPLPERSFDAVRAGLDRTLLAGLLAARGNGPVVAVISIDARTRQANPIHPPFLAALGDEQLGLDILSSDVDGVTRHFSLMVPTEDGGFPTFVGRLCRALSRRCGEGLIHFGLGTPLRYVPLQQVLESRDPETLAELFRDRIVMIGEVQPLSGRVAVPFNLAGWESGGETSPGVVVHAQALRTALLGAAPEPAARPVVLLLVMLAAVVVLMRDARLVWVAGLLGALGLFAGATFLLGGGLQVPIAAGLFTLALAAVARTALAAWRSGRRRIGLRNAFAGRLGPGAMKELLRGTFPADHPPRREEAAFVSVGLRDPTLVETQPPAKAMEMLERFDQAAAAAVYRHGGMVERSPGGDLLAVFGAPRPVSSPCRAAWKCLQDFEHALDRINAERARENAPPLEVCAGLALGPALVGRCVSTGPLRYAVVAEAAREAQRLHDEARQQGGEARMSGSFRKCLDDSPPSP
jgi:adenylate cyclase